MSEYWLAICIMILTHVNSVEVAINPAREECIRFQHSDYIIKRGCECVVYQSLGLSQGTFHSPNYPSIYARGIGCILFTFIGDQFEIVEVTFIEMDIKPRYRSRCADYLRLYQNLDGPEVNEYSKHDEELCGNITDLNQKTYYSKDRALIMEFHSDEGLGNFTGFKGRYRFIDKNYPFPSVPDVLLPIFPAAQFKTSGIKKDGFPCSYDFHSFHNNTKGYFFSPLYPQNYPANSKCSYTFYGHAIDERVKIIFMNIQLQQGTDSRNCDTSTDYIIIYDGLDSYAPKKQVLCGHRNNEMVVSNASNLYIEFRSDRNSQGKGFGATYEFIPKNKIPILPPNSVSNVTVIVASCNKNISHMENNPSTANGTIESPQFDSPYPPSSTCTYEFYGLPRDRIQIRFTHFMLSYVGGRCEEAYDCSGQDSIWIYVDRNNRNTNAKAFCGCKLPPQYMSDSPWMKVRFVAQSKQLDSTVTGFSFQYSFRTDFGITTGIQDPDKVCTFSYYSKYSRNGTFISPNHPWQYPKNVTCKYVFIGQKNERIRIIFDYFDVDGIKPSCEDDVDKSDYVAYSNFRDAADKGSKRLCGKMRSRYSLISDGAYFRIEFITNEVYQGRGFKGRYEFFKDKSGYTTQSPLSSANSGPSSNHLFSIVQYLIIFVLLIVYV